MGRLTDWQRMNRKMEEILTRQADPNKPSPLAERWAFLDRLDNAGRRALQDEKEGGG